MSKSLDLILKEFQSISTLQSIPSGSPSEARAARQPLSFHGTSGATAEQLDTLTTLGARLLPPELDPRDVFVVVPAPPTLDGLDDDARVLLLTRSYRGAFERAYGVRAAAFAGDRVAARTRVMLLDAAARLEVLRCPPAAWCRFAFAVWAALPTAGRPTPRWAFSARLIVRYAGEAEQIRSALSGDRLLMPPEMRALAEDRAAMWAELVRRMPKTRDELADVVEAWFPGSTWDDRLVAAQQARERLRREVEALVAAGGDLW